MPSYEIVFARSARKELQALPSRLAIRIVGKIELLAFNPRPVGCIKLHGHSRLWRIRIGEYVSYTTSMMKSRLSIYQSFVIEAKRIAEKVTSLDF